MTNTDFAKLISEKHLSVEVSVLLDEIEALESTKANRQTITNRLSQLTNYIEENTPYRLTKNRSRRITHYSLQGAKLLLALYECAFRNASEKNKNFDLNGATKAFRKNPQGFLAKANWSKFEVMLEKARHEPYHSGGLIGRTATLLFMRVEQWFSDYLKSLKCKPIGVIIGPRDNPDWVNTLEESLASHYLDLGDCLIIYERQIDTLSWHRDKDLIGVHEFLRPEGEGQTEVLFTRGNLSLEAKDELTIFKLTNLLKNDCSPSASMLIVAKNQEADQEKRGNPTEFNSLNVIEALSAQSNPKEFSTSLICTLLIDMIEGLANIRDRLTERPTSWYYSASISQDQAKADLNNFIEDCVLPILPSDVHVYLVQPEKSYLVPLVNTGEDHGFAKITLVPPPARWTEETHMPGVALNVQEHPSFSGGLPRGQIVTIPLVDRGSLVAMLLVTRQEREKDSTNPIVRNAADLAYLFDLAEIMVGFIARRETSLYDHTRLKLSCSYDPFLTAPQWIYRIYLSNLVPDAIASEMAQEVEKAIDSEINFLEDQVIFGVLEMCDSRSLTQAAENEARFRLVPHLMNLIDVELQRIIENYTSPQDEKVIIRAFEPLGNNIYVLFIGATEEIARSILSELKSHMEVQPHDYQDLFQARISISYKHSEASVTNKGTLPLTLDDLRNNRPFIEKFVRRQLINLRGETVKQCKSLAPPSITSR
jgi:hypothetical protein